MHSGLNGESHSSPSHAVHLDIDCDHVGIVVLRDDGETLSSEVLLGFDLQVDKSSDAIEALAHSRPGREFDWNSRTAVRSGWERRIPSAIIDSHSIADTDVRAAHCLSARNANGTCREIEQDRSDAAGSSREGSVANRWANGAIYSRLSIERTKIGRRAFTDRYGRVESDVRGQLPTSGCDELVGIGRKRTQLNLRLFQ